ncbi:MAG: transcription elongation factor GreA [Candidatus Pacebacteria bacterium]|nr:transcription elongation factor GreA [Candidatus Paceibacterota bacterium]
MKKCFTKEAIEKLKKELYRLENEKRNEVAEKLKYAASFGDLSENSAYDEAKDEQNMLESKISQLRQTIKEATIIEKEGRGGSVVQMGSKITVESDEEEDVFEIVSGTESDPLSGKISCESPIGKSFLGKSIGDECLINTPSGEVKYKIKTIE